MAARYSECGFDPEKIEKLRKARAEMIAASLRQDEEILAAMDLEQTQLLTRWIQGIGYDDETINRALVTGHLGGDDSGPGKKQEIERTGSEVPF